MWTKPGKSTEGWDDGSPGLPGLVCSQQQGGDVREREVAPLQTGDPSDAIKHALHIQGALCKRLLDLLPQRKIKQNNADVTPLEASLPPPPRLCSTDLGTVSVSGHQGEQLQHKVLLVVMTHWANIYNSTRPQVTFRSVQVDWVPLRPSSPLGFPLTFPNGGQQVQATVGVKGLQEVLHSLRVRVVQLKKNKHTQRNVSILKCIYIYTQIHIITTSNYFHVIAHFVLVSGQKNNAINISFLRTPFLRISCLLNFDILILCT